MVVSNSYFWELIFLRFKVSDSYVRGQFSYVWGLVFLRLGVSDSYVRGLVFFRLEVIN